MTNTLLRRHRKVVKDQKMFLILAWHMYERNDQQNLAISTMLQRENTKKTKEAQ